MSIIINSFTPFGSGGVLSPTVASSTLGFNGTYSASGKYAMDTFESDTTIYSGGTRDLYCHDLDGLFETGSRYIVYDFDDSQWRMIYGTGAGSWDVTADYDTVSNTGETPPNTTWDVDAVTTNF